MLNHGALIRIFLRSCERMKRTCDDGICGCDGRDDILDNALSERPCHAFDLEFFRTRSRDRVEPANMLGVVRVHLFVYTFLSAQDEGFWDIDIPFQIRGHSSTDAHSIQCSGSLGVLAMVQIGKAVGLFSMSREHS